MIHMEMFTNTISTIVAYAQEYYDLIQVMLRVAQARGQMVGHVRAVRRVKDQILMYPNKLALLV